MVRLKADTTDNREGREEGEDREELTRCAPESFAPFANFAVCLPRLLERELGGVSHDIDC